MEISFCLYLIINSSPGAKIPQVRRALKYLWAHHLMFQVCPIPSASWSEQFCTNTFHVWISNGCKYSQFAYQHFAKLSIHLFCKNQFSWNSVHHQHATAHTSDHRDSTQHVDIFSCLVAHLVWLLSQAGYLVLHWLPGHKQSARHQMQQMYAVQIHD